MASDGQDRTSQRAAEVLARLVAEPLPPGLYVVATPIGNLADITLRALAVLERADVIYCEDTRHSRTLLAHYSISRPLRAYHEHNAERERPHILAELAEGKRVALISDAGTPLISDPGYKLVRAVIGRGPRRHQPARRLCGAHGARRSRARHGHVPVRGVPAASTRRAPFAIGRVESHAGRPWCSSKRHRVSAESIADIASVLGDREMVIARELTKLHEEFRRGSPSQLVQWAEASTPRGEMVVLVGPPTSVEVTDEAILLSLRPLLAEESLRDASKAVADVLGVAKARVYDLGLALKRGDHN